MEAGKYRLTEDETKECIENVMIQLSALAKPSEEPKIEFIVGQPGAGKTALAALSKRECNEEGESIISVSSDIVATYHKYYKQLLNFLPEERYKITREFVNPALDVIYKELMKRKINQVVESTFANTEKYRKLMLLAKEYGYKINVNIMAVDRYESLISCYEREINMMKLDLEPRGIDKENHDKPYKNMLTTINELRGLFDVINVYVRGTIEEEPIKLYSSNERDEDVCQVIEKCRNMEHKNKLKNWKEYFQRIEGVKTKIKLYGKNPTLVENSVKGLDQIKAEMQMEIMEERSI